MATGLGGASRRTLESAAWIVLGVAVASPAPAGSPTRDPSGFGVEFADCVESIGVGLVATERVRALVPPEFQLAGEGGPVTPLVVRTARCGRIAVAGRRPRAGTIVQIGAVIVPPDFTGDINNYTLWYYTSNPDLAHHLDRLGVPAQHVPTLDYDHEPGECGGPGSLRVAVSRPGQPALRLDGFVTAPGPAPGSFEANWWAKGRGRVVKMATGVPEIFIGGADLVLTTRERSELGRLIGGETLGFPLLQQFNAFGGARMEVEIVAP